MPSGIPEFDRVAGGGLVAGSAILVGGDPGIGKSTLLLQIAAAMAGNQNKIVYVSGEEAVGQIRLRAQRLSAENSNIFLIAETGVEDILATLRAAGETDLLIVDSIQTLWSDLAQSAPGTVTQVRTSVHALIRFAKETDTIVILVGHVTKDGQIAGPRVVEHMVDAVLYFEGDSGNQYRILRTVKNRFGPAGELGIFEMTDTGLKTVTNPSQLFIGARSGNDPGTAIFASMEGSRPLLVEVQALVAPTRLGTPRRAAVGWDTGRLAMILAVLEARYGVKFGSFDVYLNIAGGMRLVEPAADLAVAVALISSATGVAVHSESVYFGEISLSGEVRPVSQSGARLREAERLGFTRAVVPADTDVGDDVALELVPVGNMSELVALFAERSVSDEPS